MCVGGASLVQAWYKPGTCVLFRYISWPRSGAVEALLAWGVDRAGEQWKGLNRFHTLHNAANAVAMPRPCREVPQKQDVNERGFPGNSTSVASASQ